MEGVVCDGGDAQDNRSGRGAYVSPTSIMLPGLLPFVHIISPSFPDIGYFRASAVQNQLASILFLYAVLHPHVGYRQGMHELLAPIYYAIDFDSLPDTSESDDFSELCARRWVAADAWVLFDRIMSGAGQWYEWRESPQRQVPAVAGLVHLNGKGYTDPHVTPILHACNRVQGDLLKSVDPVLWGRLQAEGIEPQMYGMWVISCLLVGGLKIGHRSRWLRLLFTREFNIHDAMVLWDGLFAVDPSLEVALWICVAMLIRIRNQCASFVPLVTRTHQSCSDTLGLQWSTDMSPSLLVHPSCGFYGFCSTSSYCTPHTTSTDTTDVAHSCCGNIYRL